MNSLKYTEYGITMMVNKNYIVIKLTEHLKEHHLSMLKIVCGREIMYVSIRICSFPLWLVY